MNESEFTRKLLGMKREVLALKTAHARAASPATVHVKEKALAMSADQTYLMTIIIDPNSPPNPLIQVLLPSFESRYGRFSFYEDPNYPDSAYSFRRKVRWVRSQTFTFRVLCTSAVQSISFEETTA